MRFFFRSRQFKMIVTIFVIVVLIAVLFGINGSRMSPGSDAVSTVTAPIREVATNIFGSVKNFFVSVSDNNTLILENEKLKKKVDKLNTELTEAEKIKADNEFYKNYLGIKDEHQDFVFMDASLVSRDSDDPYMGFVINKGSVSGIHKYDPVITDAGLVGYITDVGMTTSKVTTVLSPDLTLGAIDNRTSDSGIVSGELKLAAKKKCKISNLSRSCSVAIGDYISTSGEGIFPAGILIGKIDNIGSDKYNTSIYAELTPFVDFGTVKSVMVITDFAGKGGITVGSGD